MEGLVLHLLRLLYRCTSPVSLPELKGPVIRGALVEALRDGFCASPALQCADCPMAADCPICHLVATSLPGGPRGREIPRPIALRPLLSVRTLLEPNDLFEFGISLFGASARLFPYLMSAALKVAETGIGLRPARAENSAGGATQSLRGGLELLEVWAVNPLEGVQQRVYGRGSRCLRVPAIPITHEQIAQACQEWAEPGALRVVLLTPMRLVVNGALVRRLTFPSLLQRILGRLSDLTRYYAETPLTLDFSALLRQAQAIETVEDRTRWLDSLSHSSRTGVPTPIGGLVGEIIFQGDLAPFLPWLLWGQYTQVGKDCTKGNGWYEVVAQRQLPS